MSQAETEARVKRKTAALTIRMTQETREILDAAAHREQRSVSEMAEIWITSASRGEQSYRERIGGSQVAEAIEALLQFAGTIKAEIGDPRTDLPARDALLAGWRLLIDKALPYTPNTQEGVRFHMHSTNLSALARRALEICIEPANFSNSELTMYVRGESGWEIPNKLLVNALAAYQPPPLWDFLKSVADGPTETNAQALLTRLNELAPAPPALSSVMAEIAEQIPQYLDTWKTYITPRIEALDRGERLAKAWEPTPLPRRR